MERALHDLQVLGEEDAVKNRIVAQSIESKLPDSLKEKWLTHKNDPASGFSSRDHFDCLLQYLKRQEDILEELDQLQIQPGPVNKPEKLREKKAFTRATLGNTQNSPPNSCIVCGDDVHAGKLFACKVFKRLNLSSKKTHLKKAGACFKCLRHHGEDGGCNLKFLCSKDDCRRGASSDHNYLLCPKPPIKQREKTNRMQSDPREERRGLGLTDKQEELLAKLSPELKAEFKEAFSNKASTTLCGSSSNKLKEYPVIMMLLEVTTNSGQLIGALIDLASDTNYISTEAAERLKLNGESIKMIVQGVGGMEKTVSTKRYTLRLRIKTPKGTVSEHKLLCYGLDNIAMVNQAVTPEQLRRFFPDVATNDLIRPKKIDLLVSHREGRLVPQPTKVEGDLVLWDGPLGKTVGGTHPELFEEVDLAVHRSDTHFARSMRTASKAYREILVDPAGSGEVQETIVQSTATSNKEVFEWFKWDSVGAACDPQCGGCKCGRCPPGGKEMTLGEERDLEKIKVCLTYVQADKHCETPHWDAAYPWKGDPATLPDNRRAVEATFLNTEKRLEKEPEWKAAYREQIHDMVSRGAAAKLTKDEIDSWKGTKWYISHLVAPNPHSTTTPVRIVWNSSQEFMGVSLNDLLYKGPDVLNQIRGVLLRFRSGLYAALGDVKKMYNSVWLKDKEVHLHRFLWRDRLEDDIEVFAVVRVNIGDKPAGCIAQVAMRETANLPQFAAMVEERRFLVEDSYVDDILTSHDETKTLEKITKGVEEILKAGGFSLKPWIFSGQSGRSEATANSSKSETVVSAPKTLVLPNQMQDEESKALGVGYEPETDKLRIMMSINFSKKRGKMRTGLDLREDEVRSNTPNPLTRRVLLSQIAAFYDPIGLATPAKQKGVMLVRESYQEAGKDNSTKDTWDDPLSPKLREASIRLFEEYVRLGHVRFERSLTPPGAIGRPVGVTFSDGSEASYGAVLYLRWETQNGVVVRLVESKAKLTPLNQKGDVIKAELCGAVFATRLKRYFEKHCRIDVTHWIHFVDSQTILGAIQKDSYGYQTFFANRIGEIQKAGPVEDWRWVEGNLNISDIITRGASPEELGEESEWQRGPEFLKWPEAEWPVKTASEIVATVADDVKRLKRKAFSAVITRAQSKKMPNSSQVDVSEDMGVSSDDHSHLPLQLPLTDQDPTSAAETPKRKLSGVALVRLVEPKRFSTLSKLCGTVAWTRRAVEFWLKISDPAKWEAKYSRLSSEERAAAFQDLVLAAQDGVEFHDTTLNRLVVFKDDKTGLLLCGGRVQSWNEDGTSVPLIPFQSWLGTLLAREAHESNHEGVAATLLRTRRKAWMVQGRRIVKKVINECLTCKKQRARLCQQVMSDLPRERSSRANPFEYTTLDLFGPFEVRDAVKKRVKKKVWGVVYCCMASRAVHADLVDDQSSESFLQAYSRFTALRGHPKKLWSDRGSNFVGAKPTLRELHRHLACLQKDSVEDMAARNGTEWQWDFHPADAPHRNGAAEAAVKLIKRALHSLCGSTSCYTWGEFQTLLYSAANLTNDRPIDAKAQEQEDAVEYLTPNSLILGRTGLGGDMHGINMETHPWRRLRAVQAGVDKFWSKWSELAGPNLFIRHKWHRIERSVKVGDVVWLADQNALRGQFRLGRVVTTYPDKKGIVRDVDLKICIGLSGPQKVQRGTSDLPTTIVLRRDVRRLVVLIPVEDYLK